MNKIVYELQIHFFFSRAITCLDVDVVINAFETVRVGI